MDIPNGGEKDIVSFLEKHKSDALVKSLNWGRLRSRIMAFIATMKGEFTLREFFQLILPGPRRPQDLLTRYEAWHDKNYENFIATCMVGSKAVSFRGSDFHYTNAAEMVSLVYSIITRDQYHAKQFIKEDSVIIDAGANIGTFALFVATLAPRGQVYAFEPAPKTFALLKSNTQTESHITCMPFGLGDVVGKKNILIKQEEPSGGSVIEDSPFFEHFKNDPGVLESIDVTTIDMFMKENNVSRVDFIKIDTEGYEAKVLEGARETIKKHKPVIAMSAYHNLGDKKELPRLLREICPDYYCKLSKDCEEDFICYPSHVLA